MNDEAREILKKQMANLPPALQRQEVWEFVANEVRALSEKHALHIDQSGALETELALRLVGIEAMSDFVPSLRTALSISEEKANALVKDINDSILTPILDYVKAYTATDSAPSGAAAAPADSKPPHDAFAAKLMGAASAPPVVQNLSTPTAAPAPATIVQEKKSVDPYREPPT